MAKAGTGNGIVKRTGPKGSYVTPKGGILVKRQGPPARYLAGPGPGGVVVKVSDLGPSQYP